MADRRTRKKPKPKSFGKRPSSGPPQVQSATSSITGADQEQDHEASLERELAWCIQKLQQGLVAEKQDSRRVQDAMKILKVLQNPNAPLVKKRQLMRNTFGDYRKKMMDEERQYSTNARRVTLQTAESKHINQATFFKKSAGHLSAQTSDSAQSNGTIELATSTTEPFKFNFSVDGSSAGDPLVEKSHNDGSNALVDNCGTTAKDTDGITAISATVSALDIGRNGPEAATGEQGVNYYKMETTGGKGFSFNFTQPDDT